MKTPLYSLSDSGAVSNVVSPKVFNDPVVTAYGSIGDLTVANWSRVGLPVHLNYFSADHGGYIVKMDFVVLDNPPFYLVIERPTVEIIGVVLNFQRDEVLFSLGRMKTIVSMILLHQL